MAAHRLRQIGAGLVFAFEPHPINFADLQRNQQLNNMSNLILIQKAAADQTTQMRLFSSPLSGAHSLRQFPFHNDSYEVECITLDDFITNVSSDLSAPSANRHLGRSRQSTKVRRYLHRL